MTIIFTLLFVSLFAQASQLQLLIPYNCTQYFIDNESRVEIDENGTCRREYSIDNELQLEVDENGTCCTQYSINNQLRLEVVGNGTRVFLKKECEKLPNNEVKQAQQVKSLPEYCNCHMELSELNNRPRVAYYSFPKEFWDWVFLIGPYYKNRCYANLSQGKQSIFVIESPKFVEQFYRNDQNQICYYSVYGDPFRYVDLLPLSKEYAHLFQPIKNIRKSMRDLDTPYGHWLLKYIDYSGAVITIWKNLFIFLKNYFYSAHGNRRLQKSLREVFLSNAGVVFRHLIRLYYCGILFLLSRSNSSFVMIFAKIAAIMHLAVHVVFNYARSAISQDIDD